MISVFLWRRVLYFPISLQYISKVLHSILQKCCRLLWNYSNLLQCFRNCQDKNSLEETLYFDPLFSRFHFTMFLCFFHFFPECLRWTSCRVTSREGLACSRHDRWHSTLPRLENNASFLLACKENDKYDDALQRVDDVCCNPTETN